jgi:hypothetical protein
MEDLDSRLDKSNFDPMQSTFFLRGKHLQMVDRRRNHRDGSTSSVANISRWWIVVAIIAMGPRLP